MMRAEDPPAPKPPSPAQTLAIAVVTAACTAAATELGKWAVEAIKERATAKKPRGDE